MRSARTLLLGALVLGACGDGGGSTVDPVLIPGGGASSGPIDGVLHIYVVDKYSDTPVVGAAVRVETDDPAAPLTATTDATGLASFTDVQGPQTVTITAAGYRTGTAIGLDAANFTTQAQPLVDPSPQTGHASGTIDGWDDLPAPATNHLSIAIVTFSQTTDFDDPANAVEQPPSDPPENACFRTEAAAPPCAWDLDTRTGPQALVAILADVDTMGTPGDEDNVLTPTGLAYRRGLDVAAGASLTNQDLAIIPDAAFVDMTVGFEAAPAGLTEVGGFAIIRLGEEGQLPLAFSTASPEAPTISVPALTGDLSTASFEVIATARSETASTTVLVPNAAPGTVAVGAWMATPASPSAAGGTYTFQGVAGASVHSVTLSGADGDLWEITILDDTTSFTLPPLATDPLPTGELTMTVGAIELEGFDPRDFQIDDVRDSIRRTSENSITFTH